MIWTVLLTSIINIYFLFFFGTKSNMYLLYAFLLVVSTIMLTTTGIIWLGSVD